eukprot:643864-Amphidinium_carterae.1
MFLWLPRSSSQKLACLRWDAEDAAAVTLFCAQPLLVVCGADQPRTDAHFRNWERRCGEAISLDGSAVTEMLESADRRKERVSLLCFASFVGMQEEEETSQIIERLKGKGFPRLRVLAYSLRARNY